MTKQPSFHHGNLRQALIDAAIFLLDKQGVAGTTLRAVAAEAGVSHAAPANHFKDRRALLTAVAAHEFVQLRDRIKARLSRSKLSGADRIRIFPAAVSKFAMQFPGRYELLWRSDLVDHEDPELLVIMDEVYESLCTEIRQTFRDDAFDVHTIAVSIWSMTHGYVSLRLSGMFVELEDKVRNEPRFDAMMSLLTGSLRPTDEPVPTPPMPRSRKARVQD